MLNQFMRGMYKTCTYCHTHIPFTRAFLEAGGFVICSPSCAAIIEDLNTYEVTPDTDPDYDELAHLVCSCNEEISLCGTYVDGEFGDLYDTEFGELCIVCSLVKRCPLCCKDLTQC